MAQWMNHDIQLLNFERKNNDDGMETGRSQQKSQKPTDEQACSTFSARSLVKSAK